MSHVLIHCVLNAFMLYAASGSIVIHFQDARNLRHKETPKFQKYLANHATLIPRETAINGQLNYFLTKLTKANNMKGEHCFSLRS